MNIYPNTYAYQLMQILSVVGEYPRNALSLIGDDRMLKRLIVKGKERQEFNLLSGEKYEARLFVEYGSGAMKSIRLNKDALPILKALDSKAEDYYLDTFKHHFASRKTERKHRVAEVVALMHSAGIEYRPYVLPELQNVQFLDVAPRPSFYMARELKTLDEEGISKVAYTRIVGALISAEKIYAVYNTRNSDMKWVPTGEFKAKDLLAKTGRFNAGITTIDSAIIIGESLKSIMATITKPKRNNDETTRLDSLYPNFHYVPPDANGIKILRLIAQPGWRRIILDALFPKNMQPSRQVNLECDAIHNGTFILSMLDCNIARLQRLKDAISMSARGEHEIICYEFQAAAIEEYMEGMAAIRPISITEIEPLFGGAP